MKTKLLHSILALALFAGLSAQSQENIVLFTAIDSTLWTQLDSIKIINRSQPWGCDTTLYWPDTVLNLNIVGLSEINSAHTGLKIFQNYPNPILDKTNISIYLPEKDEVNITITDILGRTLIQTKRLLDKGYHSFSFEPGGGKVYFCTSVWRGVSGSIKMLSSSIQKSGVCALKYVGKYNSYPNHKAAVSTHNFIYNLGDTLIYVGYIDTLESGIRDVNPAPGELITFQFAYNIPCPGVTSVEYEGITYSTVQIFSQCWMKENLNVGTMIYGYQDMKDNDTIEKYCNQNTAVNCDMYGGLYQWDEMMQYVNDEGAKGICPPGWHLPSDEDWKLLQGATDSQYGIGDIEWDGGTYMGYDVGLNLKSLSGWSDGENGIDLYGFAALPGGVRKTNGNFSPLGGQGWWWTSSEISEDYSAWGRVLWYRYSNIFSEDMQIVGGQSVRCIRDDVSY